MEKEKSERRQRLAGFSPIARDTTQIEQQIQEQKKDSENQFMKWSIPGNALFVGAVFDVFLAIAMGQALWESRVEEYFVGGDITARVRLAFGVRAFYTLVHGIWLLRIRSFLSMPQLRYACGFQVVRRTIMAFWVHNQQILKQNAASEHVADLIKYQSWTVFEWITQLTVLIVFVLGFLWAGQAEGFSSILTSEKDDDFGASQQSRRRVNIRKMD